MSSTVVDRVVVRRDRPKRVLRELEADRKAEELGLDRDAQQRAFKLSNVAADGLRQE